MGKRFLHNRAAVVTVAFVLLIALIGILAPLLAPHDPYVTDILNKFAPYSLEYPLGTGLAKRIPSLYTTSSSQG